MSGAISLEKSIRTCKVDTGWANKLESDRFLNPNLMLCPPWNGQDTSGRSVCWDSYYTKTPGCNSATDRVNVENALRPQYIEYVNLDAAGIRGGLDCGANRANIDSKCNARALDETHNYTGQYGYQTGFSQNVVPNCMACSSNPDRSAVFNQQSRAEQFNRQGRKAFNAQAAGGNRQSAMMQKRRAARSVFQR